MVKEIPLIHFGSPSSRNAQAGSVFLITFFLLFRPSFSQAVNKGREPFPTYEVKVNPRKYEKSGEFATNRLDEQEVAALSLHLLQICLVYVNTLLIQQVLADPKHFQQMKKEDLRALTPLIYGHVTPYGTFRLDLTERMPIEKATSA